MADSKIREAWLDYRAEEYPDETESEVLTPLAAAFEAGWMAAEEASDRRVTSLRDALQKILAHDRFMTTCPACGAEAWVNIDCDLCMVCSELEKD